MKPTQEQVIAWAREAEAYETDDPANANERIWVMNDEELQAAIAIAYEAGRKDENEEIAVEFDKRHEAVKHRNNYFLHAANYVRARREQ